VFVRRRTGFLAGANFGLAAAAENVEETGNCNDLRARQACRFENGLQFPGADHGVHLRDALPDLVAIALHQAAGDNQPLGRARAL